MVGCDDWLKATMMQDTFQSWNKGKRKREIDGKRDLYREQNSTDTALTSN